MLLTKGDEPPLWTQIIIVYGLSRAIAHYRDISVQLWNTVYCPGLPTNKWANRSLVANQQSALLTEAIRLLEFLLQQCILQILRFEISKEQSEVDNCLYL